MIGKIGYVKYNGKFEIGEELLGTTGSTDLRTGYLEAILQAGNSLRVYTPPSRACLEFLKSSEGMRRFSSLELRKDRMTVDSDLDLLIVENGASNSSFGSKVNKREISCLAHSNSLISSYKGLLIYCQTDPDLPFVFYPEFFSKDFVVRYLSLGNFESFLKDKTFVVTTPAKNIQEFVESRNTYRYPYEELQKRGILHFSRWEVHYGCLTDYWKFQIDSNPVYQLSYVGAERSRKKKFSDLFESVASEFSVHVWGKWTESTTNSMPSIHWMGVLEKGKSREIYNKSVASIIIGNESYEKMNFVGGRLFEVVSAKTVPLIDIAMLPTTVSEIFDQEFLLHHLLVNGSESVRYRMNRLISDPSYRRWVIEECQRQVSRFSPSSTYEELERLYHHYKSLPVDEDSVSKARVLLKDLILKRETEFPGDFGKIHMNEFIRKIYNSDQDEFQLDRKNSSTWVYDNSSRCSLCGDKIHRSSSYSSQERCALCKKEGEDGGSDRFDRFQRNLEEFMLSVKDLWSSVTRFSRREILDKKRIVLDVPTYRNLPLLRKFFESYRAHVKEAYRFSFSLNLLAQGYTSEEEKEILSLLTPEDSVTFTEPYPKPIRLIDVRNDNYLAGPRSFAKLLVDDDFIFKQGSFLKYEDAAFYLQKNPQCGAVMCYGFYGSPQKGGGIWPTFGGDIWCGVGMMFRGNRLTLIPSSEGGQILGTNDDHVILISRYLEGEYLAKQWGNPTLHKKKTQEVLFVSHTNKVPNPAFSEERQKSLESGRGGILALDVEELHNFQTINYQKYVNWLKTNFGEDYWETKRLGRAFLTLYRDLAIRRFGYCSLDYQDSIKNCDKTVWRSVVDEDFTELNRGLDGRKYRYFPECLNKSESSSMSWWFHPESSSIFLDYTDSPHSTIECSVICPAYLKDSDHPPLG
jgi:hypothetical protein